MADYVQHPSGLWVPDSIPLHEQATVFCDESGNSGPNYLDVGQPFYVLAGWFVPKHRIAEAAVEIDKIRNKYFRQRSELKSSAVLRNDGTKIACASLFEKLAQLGCFPLYLVAEKKFCVAGKIIETFLDPAFNKVLNNAFTADVESKQEIANTLYRVLPEEVLKRFAEAYREPTAAGLGTALKDLAKAVESHVSPELSKAVEGCEPQIDEIAQVESQVSPLGDVAGTLNMPVLVSFLMLVENLGRLGVARPIKVIHDQQHAYQDGYKRIFNMHRQMPRLFARFPHTELGYSNLEHVAEFEMQDSEMAPLIQASDLLAGVIHHCFKLAMGSEQPTPADLQLAAIVLPGILMANPRLTWIICSEHAIKRLGERILQPALQKIDPTMSAEKISNQVENGLAPIFPQNKKAEATTDIRLKVDLPLFAVASQQSGQLMVVNNPDAPDAEIARVVYFFTSKAKADSFLGLWDKDELNETQHVIEFGPGDIPRLAELLEEVAAHCEVMTIDPAGPPFKFSRISEFREQMLRILDRVRRIFTSGLNAVMIQKHTVGTAEFLSIYCHEGNYAAMGPSGKIYFAKTREEAVAAMTTAELP